MLKTVLLHCCVFIFFCSYSFAQDGPIKDPAAQSLLNKLNSKYKSYNTMEVLFDLVIDYDDGTSENQNGKLIQDDDRYLLDAKDQSIYCDGKTVWVYLKNNNEVQIDNVYPEDEEELSSFSPRDMLDQYDNGDYAYAISKEGYENKHKVTQIEFKPLNPDEEYFKVRMTVDRKKNEITRMKVFNKDGSRYTLYLIDIRSNKTYDPGVFRFDSSKYPNIYIEDLRID